MVWSKLDDGILDNPKVARVGPLGFAYYAAGLVYANRNLTDGFIPFNIAPRLLPTRWLTPTDDTDKEKVWEIAITSGMAGFDTDEAVAEIITVLVINGLWDPVEGGYEIHDFLDHNPPRETVLAEREKAKARMRKLRGFADGSPEVRENFARSSVTPGPVPVPVPKEESTTPPVSPSRGKSDALLLLWEAHRGPMAKCTDFNSKLRTAALARLRAIPDLERHAAAIRRAAASAFCRGEVEPTNGHRRFKGSLSWYLRPDTLGKIEEGKYDDDVETDRKRSPEELRAEFDAIYAKRHAASAPESEISAGRRGQPGNDLD